MTILDQLEELRDVLGQFRAQVPAVEEAAKHLAATLAAGGKILTCGNGGSAADALHLAEELVGRFDKDRRSLPAICLCADPTLLTCIANDFGFDRVFSRQIEGLGSPADTLVVFSSSGNSANLVTALETAKARGIRSIALLGKGGGRCAALADQSIIVPGTRTARAQEIHTFILHSWLSEIERILGLV